MGNLAETIMPVLNAFPGNSVVQVSIFSSEQSSLPCLSLVPIRYEILTLPSKPLRTPATEVSEKLPAGGASVSGVIPTTGPITASYNPVGKLIISLPVPAVST